MLRNYLNKLYAAGAYLAALFMVLLALLVLIQIVGRNLGLLIETTEISGFCLAAITFLALAHTLKGGEHIRVSLLIRSLTGKSKQIIELWCTGVGFLMIAWLAIHTAVMTYESWEYQEISPGLMAIPIWLPQLGMLLGTVIFAVALIDEFFSILAGHRPSYDQGEEEEIVEILKGQAPASNPSLASPLNPGAES